MKLDLTDTLYALSFALDKIETELIGVDTGHGKRVASLALLMGKEAGFSEEELRDFTGCCILHDNALIEYISEELAGSILAQDTSRHFADLSQTQKAGMLRSHCVNGEERIRLMPFRTDTENIILYHHENADGSGALGRSASETPLKARILHLADTIDITSRLASMTSEEFGELCSWVQKQSGKLFSEDVVDLFGRSINYDVLNCLQSEGTLAFLRKELPMKVCEYSEQEIRNIAEFFIDLVDYKSPFTQAHSRGVAEKAERMARYYGFDDEKTLRYFFAGALHDIGKLVVSNDILEKPGKLTEYEFTEMKDHAAATYRILSQIKGISDIVEWAANHHEKLTGKGYPRGLSEEDLSFEDQLMACIDIYQALTEKRPYKDGLSHEKTISIMRNMVQRGEINGKIVEDMDAAMM